jgi:hypothetical protein
VTCREARDLFSALADDALAAGERAPVEAHLAGCADCRREWERFGRTVALLHAVEPARAPVGFVDRVLEAARPVPWYRRLARDAFLPLPRKLPLEAAAILLVGGLALWTFQRMPEQQQAARVETDSRAATPSSADRPPAAEKVTAPKREPEVASRRDPAPPTSTPSAAEPAPVAQAPADTALRRSKVGGLSKDEAFSDRATPATPPPLSTPAPGTLERENKADRTAESGAAPAPRRDAGTRAPELRAAAKTAPPAGGRLIVANADTAVRDLTALVARLGGAQVAQRAEGEAIVMEVTLPAGAYAELRRELRRLGTYQPEREPADPGAPAHVSLRITRG